MYWKNKRYVLFEDRGEPGEQVYPLPSEMSPLDPSEAPSSFPPPSQVSSKRGRAPLATVAYEPSEGERVAAYGIPPLQDTVTFNLSRDAYSPARSVTNGKQ